MWKQENVYFYLMSSEGRRKGPREWEFTLCEASHFVNLYSSSVQQFGCDKCDELMD